MMDRLEKTRAEVLRLRQIMEMETLEVVEVAEAQPAVCAPSHLEIEGWCGFRDRATYGLTEAQAKELTAKLRQGIWTPS